MQSIVRAPGDLIADVVVKLVATLQVEAKKAIRVTRSSVCLVPSLPPSPPLHCRFVCTDWSGDHYTIDVWRTAGPYPHIRIAAVYKQNVHTCQP